MFVSHSFTELFLKRCKALRLRGPASLFQLHENNKVPWKATNTTALKYFCLKQTFFGFCSWSELFKRNLVKNFLKKNTSFNSMTVTGVTTLANEIYFVHLHVCRKHFIGNYDVLWVAHFLTANFFVQPIFLFESFAQTKWAKKQLNMF